MDLRLWGVRGTFPAPGAGKIRHGGHTICASVAASPNETLVVDAGTGLKSLGDRLAGNAKAGSGTEISSREKGGGPPARQGGPGRVSASRAGERSGWEPGRASITRQMSEPVRAAGPGGEPGSTSKEPEILRVHLLFTHFHLDHVMGLPFFQPLYSPNLELFVYAAEDPRTTRAILGRLMGGRLFPVGLADTPSRKEFRRFEDGLEIGDMRVTSCPLRHPQGSVAYRLDRPGGGGIVFATDTEPPESGVDRRLAAFAHGARHLVCDATYTPEEYRSGRQGWGHSTWEDGVKLAEAADVGSLHLSHLNPDHSDDMVDRWAALARERLPNAAAAAQGLVLEF